MCALADRFGISVDIPECQSDYAEPSADAPAPAAGTGGAGRRLAQAGALAGSGFGPDALVQLLQRCSEGRAPRESSPEALDARLYCANIGNSDHNSVRISGVCLSSIFLPVVRLLRSRSAANVLCSDRVLTCQKQCMSQWIRERASCNDLDFHSAGRRSHRVRLRQEQGSERSRLADHRAGNPGSRCLLQRLCEQRQRQRRGRHPREPAPHIAAARPRRERVPTAVARCAPVVAIAARCINAAPCTPNLPTLRAVPVPSWRRGHALPTVSNAHVIETSLRRSGP